MGTDWAWCFENPKEAAAEIDRLKAQLIAPQDICLPPFGHAFTVPHDRMDERFLAWLRKNCVIVTEAEYTRLAAAERVCPHCGSTLAKCYDAKRTGAIACCPDCNHRERQP